jgi:hypothetical protein
LANKSLFFNIVPFFTIVVSFDGGVDLDAHNRQGLHFSFEDSVVVGLVFCIFGVKSKFVLSRWNFCRYGSLLATLHLFFLLFFVILDVHGKLRSLHDGKSDGF